MAIFSTPPETQEKVTPTFAPAPAAPPPVEQFTQALTGGLETPGGTHINPATGKPWVGKAGEIGASQIMASTGRDPGYGVKPLVDDSEEENKRFGRDYFAAMYEKFGNPIIAAAAYNAGPGRVGRALEKATQTGKDWQEFIPASTRDYVAKFSSLANAHAAKATLPLQYQGGATAPLNPVLSAQLAHRQEATNLTQDQDNVEELERILLDQNTDPSLRAATYNRLKNAKRSDSIVNQVTPIIDDLTSATPEKRLKAESSLTKFVKENLQGGFDLGLFLKGVLTNNVGMTRAGATGEKYIIKSDSDAEGNPVTIAYSPNGAPVAIFNKAGEEIDFTGGNFHSAVSTKGERFVNAGKVFDVETGKVYNKVRSNIDPNKAIIQGFNGTPTNLIEMPSAPKAVKFQYDDKNGLKQVGDAFQVGTNFFVKEGNEYIPRDTWVSTRGGRNPVITGIVTKPEVGASAINTAGQEKVYKNIAYFSPDGVPIASNVKEAEGKNFGYFLQAVPAHLGLKKLEAKYPDRIADWTTTAVRATTLPENKDTSANQILKDLAYRQADPVARAYLLELAQFTEQAMRKASGAAIRGSEWAGSYNRYGLLSARDIPQVQRFREETLQGIAASTGPYAEWGVDALAGKQTIKGWEKHGEIGTTPEKTIKKPSDLIKQQQEKSNPVAPGTSESKTPANSNKARLERL